MTYKENFALIDWSVPIPTARPERAYGPRSDLAGPMFMKDSPGCLSLIDNTWIEGRAQRREHMKRHDVVEVGDRKPLNNGMARNETFARKHGLKFDGNH